MNFDALKRDDPVLAELLEGERRRQIETIDLIASENLCPRSVREAVGSVLTDKYAEGYPTHRWYGGCNVVDAVEQLAIDRGLRLFGGEHINVQPHSGSQANMAVYFATLEPGDTILSMDLAHGGHLTHGKKANFSGRLYRIAHYGVSSDPDEEARTDRLRRDGPAGPRGPPRPDRRRRQRLSAGRQRQPHGRDRRDVGAKLMIDMAHFAGLVVAGLHPDPVPVADFVTATTHKTLRGPRGGLILCKSGYAKAIDHTIFPGIQGGPLMHIIAGKAVAFELAMTETFKAYQAQVIANARAMADEMARLGYRLVSGGTDTHLFLVDLTAQNITGNQAQEWLGEAGIIVNKNAIPFDPRPPAEPSGLRIGTPSATSRGADENDVRQLARTIHKILSAADPTATARSLRPEVLEFCRTHPIPD